MLDYYLIGDDNRVSPENISKKVWKSANKKSVQLGGAANVANNLIGLGLSPVLISVVGRDYESNKFKEIVDDANIKNHLITDTRRVLTTKVRICNEQESLLRLDFEQDNLLDKDSENGVIESVKSLITPNSVVVISDYVKGSVTHDLIGTLLSLKSKKKLTILADTKDSNLRKFDGIDCLKINLHEAIAYNKLDVNTIPESEFEEFYKYTESKIDVKHLIITLGKYGIITRISGEIKIYNRYKIDNDVDTLSVAGSGDVVMAKIAESFALEKNLDLALDETQEVATYLTKIFGTSSVNYLQPNFVKTNVHIYQKDLHRNKVHKRIGFTNGCFDLTHCGHIEFLIQCKKDCDYLIVGLNSDASVREIKGVGRPIVSQEFRKRFLDAINCVDEVIIFDEITPIQLIKTIKPDVIFKGGDYKENEIVGHDFVKSYGGDIRVLNRFFDVSTTKIVNSFKSSI